MVLEVQNQVLPTRSLRDPRTAGLGQTAFRCTAYELVRSGQSDLSLRLRQWRLYTIASMYIQVRAILSNRETTIR